MFSLEAFNSQNEERDEQDEVFEDWGAEEVKELVMMSTDAKNIYL